MTDQNTAAKTSSNTEASGNRDQWPRRFGPLKSLHFRNTRTGKPYAIMTIDCGTFDQVAFAFGPKVVADLKAAARKAHRAGIPTRVWVKGPIEAVEKEGYTEDQMKVIYFSDDNKYPEDAAEGATGETGQSQTSQAETAAPADPDDLTEIKGVGAAVAKALNEAGIDTFAALASASDETLDAAGKGYAARAAKGGWIAQAEALLAEQKEAEDQIPF